MKQLLYYNTDGEYLAEQTEAGGDGSKVVSVIGGVAWAHTDKKVYYRFSGRAEDITQYTLTVHYKDISGNTLFPDETSSYEVYVGTRKKVTLNAKEADGLVPTKMVHTIFLTGNTDYTIRYLNPSETELKKLPLTFVVTKGGTIMWTYNSDVGFVGNTYKKELQYSINGGSWTTINASAKTAINVSAGDIVSFKGTNAGYFFTYVDVSGDYYYAYDTFAGTAEYDICGNMMSLISATSFQNLTTLSQDNTFKKLFYGNTGICSAEYLLLPAITLRTYCYASMFARCSNLEKAPKTLPSTSLTAKCYSDMFQNCTSLTAAPYLPATTLYSGCYDAMFWQCSKLSYIKCLARTFNGGNCTTSWVKGVSATGTFIKHSSMNNWTTGDHGIPSGWEVQNAYS